MNIYFARHGQTQWNKDNRVCGRTDLPLTDKGEEQAGKLAENLATENIDIIISSPLQRAVQTSEIVAKRFDCSVLIDERLIEQDYGIYEGVDRKNEDFLNNKRNFAYKYPNGESMMQVAARVYPLIEELREKYSDSNVLLICHGGVCRVLKTYFQDMTNDEYFNYSMENAGFEKYSM